MIGLVTNVNSHLFLWKCNPKENHWGRMLAAGLAAQMSSSSQLRHKRELRTHAQVNGAADLIAAASHFLHIEAKTYKSQQRAMLPTIWHYSYITYYMTPGKGREQSLLQCSYDKDRYEQQIIQHRTFFGNSCWFLISSLLQLAWEASDKVFVV